MRKRTIAALGGTAAIAVAAGAIATGGAGASTTKSRLDDGKDLQGQAKISEQQAIEAAQKRASGDLNEIDLEHAAGKLVYNVDVGSHDVKVDAATGDVVAVDQDD